MAETSLHIGKDEQKPAIIDTASALIPQQKPLDRLNEWFIEKSPLKRKEKIAFFRLMATMINAGMSLMKSLYILEEQTKDAKMKDICRKLATNIETGNTLSQGLEEFPSVFNGSEIGMIRSGEASGRLNQVLLTLADQVEKNAKIRGKIKGAMIYPVAIIVVIIGVFIAVTTMVVPKMTETFDAAGSELPRSTQFLIALSDLLLGSSLGIPNALLCFGVLAIIVIALMAWKKTPSGKWYWDACMLKVPIFGNLRQKLIMAQFARSLSTLTQSGISIVKTLDITSEVVGNEVYRRRILLTAADVKQGITIAENIQGNKAMFPSMVVSMIAVGEQTAQLDTVAEKVADFYEDEVDTMVKSLASLMEPLIIVLIGIVVGFLVTAIMTPIMQLSDVASQA